MSQRNGCQPSVAPSPMQRIRFDANGISLGMPMIGSLSEPSITRILDRYDMLGQRERRLTAYDARTSNQQVSPRPARSNVNAFGINDDFGCGVCEMDNKSSLGMGKELPDAVIMEVSADTTNRPDYTSWVNTLFPGPGEPAARSVEARRENGESATRLRDWSDEAVALSKSLLRLESLWKLDGGIELRRTTDSFDPRWKRTTSQHSDLTLYSPTSWLTRRSRSQRARRWWITATRKNAACTRSPCCWDAAASRTPAI